MRPGLSHPRDFGSERRVGCDCAHLACSYEAASSVRDLSRKAIRDSSIHLSTAVLGVGRDATAFRSEALGPFCDGALPDGSTRPVEWGKGGDDRSVKLNHWRLLKL